MASSFMNPEPPGGSGVHGRISRALDHYRAAFKPAARPVSIRRGVSHIRRTVAGCAFSDSVLVDIIAAHAIQNGYTLQLDAGPEGGKPGDKT